MSELIIKLFNKKSRFGGTREGYSVLSGIAGLSCNLLLCAVKFIIGALSGSVAITADAVNNLSDGATNAVTITGALLASKEGDREHPFGHGRVEYISALIVTFSIFIMGFELAKSSVIKILHPKALTFSPWYVAALAAAILVKLWMAYFNNKLFRLTDNINLKAVKQDSINDCFSTLATIAALAVWVIFKSALADGIIGVGVAVFVFISGIDILKEIIGPLLGEPPSKELTDELERIILSAPLVTGVHDLIVHSYGAENIIASAHAEVPADADIVEIHDEIDRAEREIAEKLGVVMCIHTDPVVQGDETLMYCREKTAELINEYDSRLGFHDLRIIEKDGEKRLSFDVVVPFESEKDNDEIKRDLTLLFGDRLKELPADITVEHSYTGE